MRLQNTSILRLWLLERLLASVSALSLHRSFRSCSVSAVSVDVSDLEDFLLLLCCLTLPSCKRSVLALLYATCIDCWLTQKLRNQGSSDSCHSLIVLRFITLLLIEFGVMYV